MPPVILASGSVARAALLRATGVAFEVRVSGVDEAALKALGGDPAQVAMALALAKAKTVVASGALVLGADQVLVCEGRRFDKPGSVAALREQLCALRGRTHELVTAAVCLRDGVELWREVARPRLTMRPFSDEFLDWYVGEEGGAVLGCVGGYRLEGVGMQLFERVEGEHAAVLGLPLLGLLRCLRGAGVLLP